MLFGFFKFIKKTSAYTLIQIIGRMAAYDVKYCGRSGNDVVSRNKDVFYNMLVIYDI